jgi:hypothetical protein
LAAKASSGARRGETLSGETVKDKPRPCDNAPSCHESSDDNGELEDFSQSSYWTG